MKNFKKLFQIPVKIEDEKTGYNKTVLVKTIRMPDGLVETFFIDQDRDSVQILPITTDNQIITVVQYRPSLETEQCELPGGGIDPGEDTINAAERELKEETSAISDEIIHLFSVHYSPYSTGVRHCFLAKNCKLTLKQNLDPGEFIKIKFYSIQEFEKLVEKAKIRGYDCWFAAKKYVCA